MLCWSYLRFHYLPTWTQTEKEPSPTEAETSVTDPPKRNIGRTGKLTNINNLSSEDTRKVWYGQGTREAADYNVQNR